MSISMNGLRIYRSPGEIESSVSEQVFYSRRSGGPYYRWDYQVQLDHWRAVRLHLEDAATRELCAANWKNVPAALQARLVDHYQE